MAITKLNDELLAKRWPSTSAAQSYLRRQGTTASKLGCIIGMAPDEGVCLSVSDLAEGPGNGNGAKPARAKAAKPAKAAKAAAAAAKPAKPAKAAADRTQNEDLIAKAFTKAKREAGVTRMELRKMRLEAGAGSIAWVPRLERLAEEKGAKFKVKHDGRHPTYYVTG